MARRLAVMAAMAAALLAGCIGSGPTTTDEAACGWDLTSEAGRQASQERLTFVNEWLLASPGVAPPSPTSTYWHGDCPTPSGAVPGPPDEENEAPVGEGP